MQKNYDLGNSEVSIKTFGEKFLLFTLLFFSVALSSKKCATSQSPPGNSTTTYTVRVYLTSNWPSSYPVGYSCGSTSPPTIGNSPFSSQGSTSLYNSTNLRFSEVTVRNLLTNTTSFSVLWTNGIGNPGTFVDVQVPVNSGYEIKFNQYDGCSGVCFTAQTNQGQKATRLQWVGTKTLSGNIGAVTITPVYTGYLICI